MKTGSVILVGAGPGDPGLLTRKGLEVLRRAEVVGYDRRVGSEILSLIPEAAEKIDVGKQASYHPAPQEESDRILLEKALEGKKTYDTWQQGFLQIFEAVLDNKPFILNVYHSVSREQVELYLYKLTYDLLIGVVEEKSAGMNVRDEDKKFIADFYKYAFVGLMLDWVKHDMKGDPHEIIEELSIVMHGNVTSALERFKTNK